MTNEELRDQALAKYDAMWENLMQTTKGATSQKKNPDGTFVSNTSSWGMGQNAGEELVAALEAMVFDVVDPPPVDPPPPSGFDPRTAWLRQPWNADAKAATKQSNSDLLIATWKSRGYIKSPNVCTNAYSSAWATGDAADPHYSITTTKYPVGKVIENVPIPVGTQASPDSDAHLVIFDTEHGREIDCWVYNATNHTAGSADEFTPLGGDLPAGKGANAAGFPQMALCIWPEEIQEGVIKHALAFSTIKAAPYHVYPATKHDGTGDNNDLPEGAWLRMPILVGANVAWPNWVQVVFKALQEHGMYLMDQGGTLGIAGVNPINGGVKWSDVGMGTGGSQGFPGDFPWDKCEVLNPPVKP